MRVARNITDHEQPLLFADDRACRRPSHDSLLDELASFRQFRTTTQVTSLGDGADAVPVFVNEFWTSKQRAASSIHEISYRACFKPQLPRFFIERLTSEEDVVYDPFLGRGTTAIEAALLRRRIVGCDINPLSRILTEPRLRPPKPGDVRDKLDSISWDYEEKVPADLLTFYHSKTLREICALRRYLLDRGSGPRMSDADRWIRMVATNRLTGHSAGFFSVYTLPPTQAVSSERQRKINEARKQKPPRRDVPDLILRKTNTLLRSLTNENRDALDRASSDALFITGSSDSTPQIEDGSVDLVVTSPPFFNVVDYAGDNWLRCWFNEIDGKQVDIWMFRDAQAWSAAMERVFVELCRVLKRGAHVAFEVGEVHGGKLKMEDLVIPAARSAGLDPVLLLINAQEFTKTSNCWGVTNRTAGTNTNRVVLLRKPPVDT
jgi:hypothetical protein